MLFDAKAFRLPKKDYELEGDYLWGGGWTNETAPWNKGWKVLKCRALGEGIYVLGNKEVKGCVSVLDIGQTIELGVYPSTLPQELKEGGIYDDYYEIIVVNIPGWGNLALGSSGLL